MCVWVCMCGVYMHMCVCVVCVHVCGIHRCTPPFVRGWRPVSHSAVVILLSYLLETGLSLSLELIVLARVADQWAPQSVCFCPSSPGVTDRHLV